MAAQRAVYYFRVARKIVHAVQAHPDPLGIAKRERFRDRPLTSGGAVVKRTRCPSRAGLLQHRAQNMRSPFALSRVAAANARHEVGLALFLITNAALSSPPICLAPLLRTVTEYTMLHVCTYCCIIFETNLPR
jgi:hypothetical protein